MNRETSHTIQGIVPALDSQSRHPVSAPKSLAVVLASFSNSPDFFHHVVSSA